jgi:hypothetical protein
VVARFFGQVAENGALTWVERKAWKNISAKTSIDGSGNELEGNESALEETWARWELG